MCVIFYQLHYRSQRLDKIYFHIFTGVSSLDITLVYIIGK